MESSYRRGVSTRVALLALAALAVGSAACGAEESQPAAPSANSGSAPTPPTSAEAPPPVVEEPAGEPDPAALVARGKQVYNSNCIACHNTNPSQPGALGPDLAGSSLALVEAKVLRNEYPAGYTPKRTTKAMIPLAHLQNDIPALVAYLDSVK